MIWERLSYKSRKKEVSLPYGWSGDFRNWEEASALCEGYQKEEILEKCKNSLLKVKNGEAVYERDSVLFDKVQYSWPLLACLLRVALENKGRLCVLDLGGSLGSSYFQNRNFLTGCQSVTWCIVEQKNFVACGKKHFENEELFFYETAEECLARHNPDVLVMSSVLQYLKAPYEWIRKTTSYGLPYILVDCTPFLKTGNDRLTIQRVPPDIYEASYPCWFLAYKNVLKSFAENYALVSEHVNEFEIELDEQKIRYQGFFLKHKQWTSSKEY